MRFSYYQSGKRYVADDGDQVICIVDDPSPNIYSSSSEIFWKYNKIGKADFGMINSKIFKHAIARVNESLKSILEK